MGSMPPMRAALSAATVVLVLAVTSDAAAQHYAPISRWGTSGTRMGRVAPTIGGGWPAVFAEVDYGVNDVLGVGLRAGYLWASPHAGLHLASGVLIEIPARYRLYQNGAIQLTLETTAGMVIGTDSGEGRISTLDEETYPEVPTIAPRLDAALMVHWAVTPSLVLKFGLEVPTTLVLAMTEPPVDDVLELTITLAPQVGVSWAATPWLSVFCLAGAGPALVWAPTTFTSDHWDHEVRLDVYLRATAGVVFTPWP